MQPKSSFAFEEENLKSEKSINKRRRRGLFENPSSIFLSPMGREDVQLNSAKRAFRSAEEVGNRREEARWANVIGDILKNRGEYVEALKWLRIDYEITVKHLPEKDLLPTCQSLGEVYLRLEEFQDALIYQKKHLQLAEDANDTAEEQRACTQLGRTYHEIFLRSEDDYGAIRNAKKYFKSAMRLARILKENPPHGGSSFLEEYIDAHNNLGMLDLDLDNLEVAQEILMKGLEICDEEEVREDDAARSRLHHNLGNVYMELRKWDKAKQHVEMDIKICHKIGHRQGESKGYINLGELHYRVHAYDDALLCYGKAFSLAKSMEDEGALVSQIEQNINIVKEAMKVMEELRAEELRLKKLLVQMTDAKGTSDERKCMLQVNASLDRLIEKSSMIFAWMKHLEFSKTKKRISNDLCDKEKLSDAFLAVGESYQKLRNFRKALKWYSKSWEGYKSIGNLEGQALAKINIGDVLDCLGEWTGAFQAFEEGYRIALEANLPSVQLSALENMHYSHMIRFENAEEARKLKVKIETLKESRRGEMAEHATEDGCSETDSEGNENLSNDRSNKCSLPETRTSSAGQSKRLVGLDESNSDIPLISFLQNRKSFTKRKKDNLGKQDVHTDQSNTFPKDFSELTRSQETVVGRKRVRVILSDDDESETENQLGDPKSCSPRVPNQNRQVFGKMNTKDASASPQINAEESSCSYKSLGLLEVASFGNACSSLDDSKAANTGDCGSKGSECDSGHSKGMQHKHCAAHMNSDIFCNTEEQKITFQIKNDLLHILMASCSANGKFCMESLKVELACLYYIQLPDDEKTKGLLPIIKNVEFEGRALELLGLNERLADFSGVIIFEAFVSGWVQKRLMKQYMDCCQELSEAPNMKLLKKLYTSEVEDEVNVSECELQDISAVPLLNALQVHNTVAMLDLSHNVLGNGTMEKLKQLFASSSQRYGDLTLDLHSNRFGPTAVFQICECPVLFTRLEVLNISRNRLTDACGSYLSTILKVCKALYSLNVEQCSLTSRTIQKVADALDSESGLSQLYIGYNNPISGNAIQNLLAKLATLSSFTELSMNGIKLSSQVVDNLSKLAKTLSLSRVLLGGTGIGTDGAVKVAESICSEARETVKLDLSCCGISSPFFHKIKDNITLVSSIIELNIGGNSITGKGIGALATLLRNHLCSIKTLILNKCQLGHSGILRIVQALSDNNNLEELNLADNAGTDEHFTIQYGQQLKVNSEADETANKPCENEPLDKEQQGLCKTDMQCDYLEVADSEDEQETEQAATSASVDACKSLYLPHEYTFIKELPSALAMANRLQMLDLSHNKLSVEASETLYASWSTGSRSGLAGRHVKEQTVHFFVEGKECCSVKDCCRKD